MSDLWQSGWTSEGASILIGAFLGALLGYAFSLYQTAQEQHRKQAVLLTHLRHELSLLGQQAPASDPQALSLRVPIRVNVIPRLLDGELLAYREHATLLEHLILLEQVIGRYNDWVTLTNEAQTLGRRSPREVAQMEAMAAQMADMIAGLRTTIVPLLGVTDEEMRRTLAILEQAVTHNQPGAPLPPRPARTARGVHE